MIGYGIEGKLKSQLETIDSNGNYIVNDQKLISYLENPGMYPSYIILSEVERRKAEDAQRQMYQAMQEGAQPSIKQQAIASLGQPAPVVPSHLVSNMPQQSPADRANSGIASVVGRQGGYVTNLAGGGIIAFKEGDAVKGRYRPIYDPDERPYTERVKKSLAETDFVNMSEEDYIKNIEELTKARELEDIMLGKSRKDIPQKADIWQQDVVDAVKGVGKAAGTFMFGADDEADLGGGGYDASGDDAEIQKIMAQGEDSSNLQTQLASKTEEELNAIQEAMDERKRIEKRSQESDDFFKGALLSTGDFDTAPYDSMIEDEDQESATAAKELRKELEKSSEGFNKVISKRIEDLEKRKDMTKMSPAEIAFVFGLSLAADPGIKGQEGSAIARAGQKTYDQFNVRDEKSQKVADQLYDTQIALQAHNMGIEKEISKERRDVKKAAKLNNNKIALQKQSDLLTARGQNFGLKVAEIKERATKDLQLQLAKLQYGKTEKRADIIKDRMGEKNYERLMDLRARRKQIQRGSKVETQLKELERMFTEVSSQIESEYGGARPSSYTSVGSYANGKLTLPGLE